MACQFAETSKNTVAVSLSAYDINTLYTLPRAWKNVL